MYYNNLVCTVQVLQFFSEIEFILAAAAADIHTPDPASANEANPDADRPTQQTLTEDEDPNEGVVNDLDVIAEVKLPSTVRKFNHTLPCCYYSKCIPRA
jgi:hypothetical protein